MPGSPKFCPVGLGCGGVHGGKPLPDGDSQGLVPVLAVVLGDPRLSSGVRVGFVMAETDAHATHHEEADVRIGGVATQVRPGTGHRVFVYHKA